MAKGYAGMYMSIQMLKICLDLQRNCLHTMKISQEVQLLIYLFFQVKQIIIKKVQLPIKTFLKLRGTCLQKFKSLRKWLIAQILPHIAQGCDTGHCFHILVQSGLIQ